jgi:hypothetical protein
MYAYTNRDASRAILRTIITIRSYCGSLVTHPVGEFPPHDNVEAHLKGATWYIAETILSALWKREVLTSTHAHWWITSTRGVCKQLPMKRERMNSLGLCPTRSRREEAVYKHQNAHGLQQKHENCITNLGR